jgi:hypothetical protein
VCAKEYLGLDPENFLWLLRLGYDCNGKQFDYKQD